MANYRRAIGWDRIMFDVIYILIGAAFLAGCALYAITCDRL